jgi:hypothetical protein
MADIIRAKYKGKDTGEGLPHFHGIPARDLTDADFDTLSDDEKETVRKSDVYDYSTYTDKPREGHRSAVRDVAPAAPEQSKEGGK